MFAHKGFSDYALLDSGGGEKLERFGDVVLARPDPQALWHRRRPDSDWKRADLTFVRDESSGGKRGRWNAGANAKAAARGAEPSWTIAWRRVRCVVRPTPFKHVGIFPEQAANWDFVERAARALALERPRLLNLFGYTGTASIAAAQSGFAVTHVDASKSSLEWLRENAAASGLAEDALRIVLDDALAFARREVRRGVRYEGILLDPPHHGRGPKGETWQLEEHLAPLSDACRELLAEQAFLVLSTYAIGFSPLAFANLLSEFPNGRVEADELALPEENDNGPPRFLPAGFCARWARGLELELR